MKIDLVSDLHIDVWNDNNYEDLIKLWKNDSKYLFIAGDISDDYKQSLEFLKICSNFYDKIFFVYGNHEYYNNITYQLDFIKKIPNVIILDKTNCHYELENWNIYGVNGWWDFKGSEPHVDQHHAKIYFEKFMKNKKLKYETDDIIMKAINDHHILNKTIKTSNNFVMTHTAPMLYNNSYNINNITIVNTLMKTLLDKNIISYWFHGHTHNSLDYSYNNCRIITNPRGNPKENKNYIKFKQIELNT